MAGYFAPRQHNANPIHLLEFGLPPRNLRSLGERLMSRHFWPRTPESCVVQENNVVAVLTDPAHGKDGHRRKLVIDNAVRTTSFFSLHSRTRSFGFRPISRAAFSSQSLGGNGTPQMFAAHQGQSRSVVDFRDQRRQREQQHACPSGRRVSKFSSQCSAHLWLRSVFPED
jgi:hypothetical protein